MNAPERAADVKAIFDRLQLPIIGKTETDEGRRANLFTIVRELNVLDGGEWGVLVKTDQGGKIPGDVIVWQSSREHFDVILGAGGPGWKVHGRVPSDKWHWQAVPGSAPPAAPAPPGATIAPEGEDTIAKFGPDARAAIGRIERRQRGLPLEGEDAIEFEGTIHNLDGEPVATFTLTPRRREP